MTGDAGSVAGIQSRQAAKHSDTAVGHVVFAYSHQQNAELGNVRRKLAVVELGLLLRVRFVTLNQDLANGDAWRKFARALQQNVARAHDRHAAHAGVRGSLQSLSWVQNKNNNWVMVK